MASLKQLAQVILKSNDANQRTEALLMIRHSDDPRVLRLLEKVQADDPDPAVRDLVKNLLVKKKIAAGMPVTPESQTTPAPFSEVDDTWMCHACGATNVDAEQPQPMIGNGAFLLDPRNRDFIEGKKRRLPQGNGGFKFAAILVPFLLLGMMLFPIAHVIRGQIDYLNANGEITTATVSDKYIEEDADNTNWHYIEVAFFVADVPYTSRHSVNLDLYNRLNPGDSIEVIYLPNNPQENMIVGTNNHETPTLITTFGMMWIAAITPLLVGALAFGVRRSLLIRNGKIIIGEVFDVRRYVDDEGDDMIAIEYHFKSPKTEHIIKGKHTDQPDIKKPRPGAKVAILYRSDWYHIML